MFGLRLVIEAQLITLFGFLFLKSIACKLLILTFESQGTLTVKSLTAIVHVVIVLLFVRKTLHTLDQHRFNLFELLAVLFKYKIKEINLLLDGNIPAKLHNFVNLFEVHLLSLLENTILHIWQILRVTFFVQLHTVLFFVFIFGRGSTAEDLHKPEISAPTSFNFDFLIFWLTSFIELCGNCHIERGNACRQS